MISHDFFRMLNERAEAVTFADVLLSTGFSEVPPMDVSLETRFSRRIRLNIPIVSAAMDTVTESQLAIEMAKAGGIGVIHRNMTPEQQAAEVARVKYSLNGLVDRPITVSPEETVEEVLRRRERKGYTFHSFPVTDNSGRLVGLLTQTEFKFCDKAENKVQDVMTREGLITASPNITLHEAYGTMMKHHKGVLPLVDGNGVLSGMYVLSDVKRNIHDKSPIYNVDENGRLRVAAAIGSLSSKSTGQRLRLLAAENVDAFVIDAAHADTKDVIATVCEIKENGLFEKIDVVVGNVSQPDSAVRLVKAQADAIKVGQGAGSICTTRIVSGTGCPQLSAIYNCTKAAAREDWHVPIIADGGVVYSGDITKALAAGASCVMLGGLLAGTREAPGNTVLYQGRQYKDYRGMGSVGAMNASTEAQARYRQPQTESGKLVPEGVEALVPYSGELGEVLHQLLGGLRSGMGSIGAADIAALHNKTNFMLISAGSQREDHPHDVLVVKEPPNYKSR